MHALYGMLSYQFHCYSIIKRMPCMVCYRISTVIAFSFLFSRSQILPKIEENVKEGGRGVDNVYYEQYENGE